MWAGDTGLGEKTIDRGLGCRILVKKGVGMRGEDPPFQTLAKS